MAQSALALINAGNLPAVRANDSEAALKAELESLRAENRKLKAVKVNGLNLKVSEKGALSVYGLGRFPQTLYKSQWLRLLAPDSVQAILDYIEAHDEDLKTKE